ncbi:MAG: sortase [Desertimonas sp.]
MKRPLVMTMVALVALVAVGSVPRTGLATPAAPDPPAPAASITISADTAAPGDVVVVEIGGFPDGDVELSACARGGMSSSMCAVRDAQVVRAVAGVATAELRVVEPPGACPCVVRATTLDSETVALAPISIEGVEVVPVAEPEPAAPSLQVLASNLVRDGALGDIVGEALGLGGTRTFEVTVRNNGDATGTATLRVDAGTRPATVEAVVAPRAVVTMRYEAEVAALAFGDVGVEGTVTMAEVPGVELTVGATSGTWPVALVFAPALLVVAALDRGWQRLRHRRIGLLRLAARSVAVVALVGAAGLMLRTRGEVAATDDRTEQAQERLLTDFAAAVTSRPTVVQQASTGVSVLPGPFAGSGDRSVSSLSGGAVFGLLRIPRLDAAEPYEFAFVEGVSPDDLTKGPGHFPGAAMPGQVGNFALSGHRRTHLAPFGDLDQLDVDDLIEVETLRGTFHYRVTQSTVVTPDRVDVLYPVPGHPDESPTRALITLITCHPEHSTRERLVVVGELVGGPT